MTLRKFCEVAIAIMLSTKPLLQACLSVGVLFISYSLQVQCKPFVDPNMDLARSLGSSGSGFPGKGSHLAYTFNYNALETLLLVTSLFILLAGMAFQGGISVNGSGAHTALTVLVAAVLVIAVVVFVLKLLWELRNSVRFTWRVRRAGRRGVGGVVATTPAVSSWMANPLKATPQAPGSSPSTKLALAKTASGTGSGPHSPTPPTQSHQPPAPSPAPPPPPPPLAPGAGVCTSPSLGVNFPACGNALPVAAGREGLTRQRVGRVHSMASAASSAVERTGARAGGGSAGSTTNSSGATSTQSGGHGSAQPGEA